MRITGDMRGDQDVRPVQEPIQLLTFHVGIRIQFLVFQHIQGSPRYLPLFKRPDQRGGIMDLAP